MKSQLKAKRGFLEGYRTYQPESEGYGNPSEWRQTFYERFTHEQAQEILNTDSSDPYQVLGIAPAATQSEIKAAFRKLIQQWHPDVNPQNVEEATRQSQKIIAAYSLLTN